MNNWLSWLMIIFDLSNRSDALVPWIGGWIIGGTFAIAGWWVTQRDQSVYVRCLQWMLIIVLPILLSPHTNTHDLSLLIVAGIILRYGVAKTSSTQQRVWNGVLIVGYSLLFMRFLTSWAIIPLVLFMWGIVALGVGELLRKHGLVPLWLSHVRSHSIFKYTNL